VPMTSSVPRCYTWSDDHSVLNLSWTEVSLSERETRVGYNDPFQPQSAVVQQQDKKRPFRRWIIAAVIIAVIGGFYLHWSSTYPTLRTSYSGDVATPTCDPEAIGWTGSISLDQVVEDYTHGTFTGIISEGDGCGSGCSATAHGKVTPSGNISFTCGNSVNFSGTIHSDGGIDGQFYYYGTIYAGNFCLNACSVYVG
jgi:hypothetical protein